ncbi:MAG: hypothetical protein A2275_00170 [Bacteroidetes bacterium RIFOXYA12_FULL_35_11]|nr:MAG: hypothetical protein A2X01_15785 [Bacteroidetes bacterium GWF2_35_48]OFY82169.1 MAG: hypothetical protein A2275_00170 [Bacteroidetes bacterium RIFOXYA12_FULL_35_11]OFY97825.1 MAG: hypothetical protein A2309_13320 [Bacteroidetes bacterium RIFOXYB2_FULL_35_7]OFZ05658.1 MAG: hypothetical protein A2491_20410 [Bacteroidetes bacterium RIFOXYC12_FULL_35_7]HBX52700.1 hypothetical protein [Bacteroidales bacterium]
MDNIVLSKSEKYHTMKKNNITQIICFFFVLSFIPFSSFSQRCDKKDICNDEDYGDYDFRSQTHFAKLSPGDTSTINIVAYSGNDMRILICSDEELGEVIYQIVESIKELKVEKVTKTEHLKDVIMNQEPDPETGMLMPKMNDNGDTIFFERDTTYIEERKYFITKDEIKFDSKSNKGKPYYEEKAIKKTKRLKIKIQVPAGDEELISCVNVLVGRKSAKSNKFYRGKE